MGLISGIKGGLKRVSSLLNYRRSIQLNGKTMVVPVNMNTGLLNLKIREDWFPDMLRTLQLPAGSSFIDVGVNVGQSLLHYRRIYDIPYWSFEPNPTCVNYLEQMIRVNRFRNVQLLPAGLAASTCLASFYKKHGS